jgi:hypothetical protein
MSAHELREAYRVDKRYELDDRAVYQIKVQGNLDDRWSDWFSGLTVQPTDEGEDCPVTTLTGPIDQAALRGILNRIWDLNLTLVSVVSIELDGAFTGGGQ